MSDYEKLITPVVCKQCTLDWKNGACGECQLTRAQLDDCITLEKERDKYREALNKIAIMQSFAERGCLSRIIASEALEVKHGNSNSL
jgi:hypothetical protein